MIPVGGAGKESFQVRGEDRTVISKVFAGTRPRYSTSEDDAGY
jgi:hypothetical protein